MSIDNTIKKINTANILLDAFGIEKVGSRELEIVDSRYVYGAGHKGEVRKVK